MTRWDEMEVLAINGVAGGSPQHGMSGMNRDTMSWDTRAACLDEDPELFFPISRTGGADDQIAAAKAVCRRCGVRDRCLEFAIRTGADDGVWGGLEPTERKRIRRRRGR